MPTSRARNAAAALSGGTIDTLGLRTRLVVLSACFMLLAPLTSGAAEPIVLPRAQSVDLVHHADYLVDEDGALDLAGVQELAGKGRMVPAPPKGAEFGFTNSVHWFRVRIFNEGTTTQSRVLLVEAPQTEYVEINLEMPGGQRTRHWAGVAVDVASTNMPVGAGGYRVALDLAAGSAVDVWIRLQTRGTLSARMRMLTPAAWRSSERESDVRRAVSLTALLVLFLGCLLAWWSTRDRTELFLAVMLLNYAFYEAVRIQLFRELWPALPPLGMGAFVAPPCLVGVFGLYFTRAFLDLPNTAPRIDRIARVEAALLGAFVILSAFYSQLLQLGSIVTLLVGLVTLPIAGVAALLAGHRPARTYVVAWAPFVLGGAAIALAFVGFTSYSLARDLLFFGFCVGVLILKFGIAVRAEERHRDRATSLEHIVGQRTEELSAAEQARRESEELFRVAFRTSPDAMSIHRRHDGIVVDVNDGFEQLTGYARGEVVGKRPGDLGIELNAGQENLEALVKEGVVRNAEVAAQVRHGVERIGLLSAKAMQLGAVPHVLVAVRDVTDLRRAERENARLEDQLRQAHKMDALGRVAGGVAHDFNNILTSILGNAALMVADIPVGHPLKACADEVQHAAVRASGLTQQLLAFSRRQVLEPRPVDLNALVTHMQKLLTRIIGEAYELRMALDPGIPPVCVDPGQMEQVLLNLVINARDAMAGGGCIGIATVSDPGAGERGAVKLSVADSGHGMTPEVRQRLFEPFFTTKPPGRGTGLGLSTVYGIVRQHGGDVGVETAPDHGSTFTVRLPGCTEAVTESPARAADAIGDGRGTVLVVEDEEGVRLVVEVVLRRAGYLVLTAEDGERALEVAAAHSGPIDLLVTDLIMPRMNGQQLADELLKVRPGTPVLFMSGYADDVLRSEVSLGLDPLHFLAKPFTPQDLASHVREALSQRRNADA